MHYMHCQDVTLVTVTSHIQLAGPLTGRATHYIGDYMYTSKSKSSRKIKLLLQNEHYTIVHPEERKTFCYWSKEERTPLTRHYNDEGKTICYDGKTEFELSEEEIIEIT